MIVTVYTKSGEHYAFLDVTEFTVAGGMEIVGTSEVDFGKQGFRFTERNDTSDLAGSDNEF